MLNECLSVDKMFISEGNNACLYRNQAGIVLIIIESMARHRDFYDFGVSF